MSLRSLPEPKQISRPSNYSSELPEPLLKQWNSTDTHSDEENDANVITVYDIIGEDWWTGEGVTEKRVAAALRSIGQNPVTVRINSPGGDVFAGFAIYNLLRQHKAKVTVEVIGIAASAASLVAMAGDEIIMAPATFIMIHNTWSVVAGNQHDMREAADLFAQFDSALVDIYEGATDIDRSVIEDMLKAETWLSASEAVEQGFAHKRIDVSAKYSSGSEKENTESLRAKRTIESTLAHQGYSRKQRSELLNKILAPRDASQLDGEPKRDASTPNKGLEDLLNVIRN